MQLLDLAAQSTSLLYIYIYIYQLFIFSLYFPRLIKSNNWQNEKYVESKIDNVSGG